MGASARHTQAGRLVTSSFGLVFLMLTACSSGVDPARNEEGSATQGLRKSAGGVVGDGDFCGPAAADQCAAGEGDCDSNTDCQAGLVCVWDVGATYGFSPTTDVCGQPAAPVNGDANFCSVAAPCASGQGDCDSNAECQAGLHCVYDVGANYGFSPDTDVCETGGGMENGDPHFCSASYRCSVGEGDCDSNSQCASGLVCGNNNGAQFGMTSETDVCVPPHCVNGVQETELCETVQDCGGDCGDVCSCGGTGAPALGTSCDTGLVGMCAPGTIACVEDALECVPEASPSTEVCDGLDNDCNGFVDETDPNVGTSCDTGLEGVCALGQEQCVCGAMTCMQTVQASAERCDSLDNDCDGQIDESLCMCGQGT